MKNAQIIENNYNDIFMEIYDNTSDYECLQIGTRILEIAKNRLDGDLNNIAIKTEYNKLENIIDELQNIIDTYIMKS